MDLTGIPGGVFVQGGAVAVLTLVVLYIVTGRLVPRKVHEDRCSDLREWGKGWKAAAEIQDARNDLLTKQVEQLLDAARTTNALIENLKQAYQEKP